MQVIPVAEHDGVLLNLNGAHAPFYWREVRGSGVRVANVRTPRIGVHMSRAEHAQLCQRAAACE